MTEEKKDNVENINSEPVPTSTQNSSLGNQPGDLGFGKLGSSGDNFFSGGSTPKIAESPIEPIQGQPVFDMNSSNINPSNTNVMDNVTEMPVGKVETLEQKEAEVDKNNCGSKLFLGIVIGFLLALVGAAGAWFFLQSKNVAVPVLPQSIPAQSYQPLQTPQPSQPPIDVPTVEKVGTGLVENANQNMEEANVNSNQNIDTVNSNLNDNLPIPTPSTQIEAKKEIPEVTP